MERWLLFCIIIVALLLVAGAVWVIRGRRRRRSIDRRSQGRPPSARDSRPDGVATTQPARSSTAPADENHPALPPSGVADRATDLELASTPKVDVAPAAADSIAPAASQRSLIVLTRPSATRHPIVLAHGYFGFERIGLLQLGQEYFRGVRRQLEALGYSVYVTRVSPTAGIDVRAAQLARQIERFGAQRVNIIAHSMGGLDARLAISRLGLAARVASLTTIGTPHHGTPLADMALSFGDWRRLRRLLDSIGMNIDGLYDVSTHRMREFNRAIVDAPEVSYASVIGAVTATSAVAVNALLLPAHAYLLRKGGPNDGIVPATSQRWGRSVAEVEADHWAQIGWFGSFDVESFYVRLAEDLAARDL